MPLKGGIRCFGQNRHWTVSIWQNIDSMQVKKIQNNKMIKWSLGDVFSTCLVIVPATLWPFCHSPGSHFESVSIWTTRKRARLANYRPTLRHRHWNASRKLTRQARPSARPSAIWVHSAPSLLSASPPRLHTSFARLLHTSRPVLGSSGADHIIFKGGFPNFF